MKTGTTTLQVALWRSRSRLREEGVVYLCANPDANANQAALGLIGADRIPDDNWFRWDRTDVAWQNLRSKLRAIRTDTAIISSEALSLCHDEAILALRSAAAHFDVHLVVTLRKLSDIIPSYWQEQAKRRPFPVLSDFTRQLIDEPKGDRVAEAFWMGQRHNALIARWQKLLTPTRTTLIIADSKRPDFLIGAFCRAAMLSSEMSERVLSAAQALKNRSRTAEEIAVRQSLLRALKERDLFASATFLTRRVNHSKRERTPLRNEHRIRLDERFTNAVLGLEREIARELTTLDIDIEGDVSSLVSEPETYRGIVRSQDLDVEGLVDASSHLAVELLVGVGLREGGKFDLSETSQKIPLPALWRLALVNTFWRALPKQWRVPLRSHISRIRNP